MAYLQLLNSNVKSAPFFMFVNVEAIGKASMFYHHKTSEMTCRTFEFGKLERARGERTQGGLRGDIFEGLASSEHSEHATSLDMSATPRERYALMCSRLAPTTSVILLRWLESRAAEARSQRSCCNVRNVTLPDITTCQSCPSSPPHDH